MNTTAAPAGKIISKHAASLLDADEPMAFAIELPQGCSDFVLSCDHASNRIPRALGTLGLSPTELSSHSAWDIGAAGVARQLAERLEATLVMQNYSRLVIDCNRPPDAADSIAERSEWVQLAGNERLSADAIAARRAAVFEPYHEGLRAVLDQRRREGRRSVLVAMHSFTPAWHGVPRPWHIGLMYRRDARLGSALLKLLRRDERLLVGDNEPYAISDASDYTLPLHGESRGIAHVGVEIRQDLIADQSGQKTWAGRLASLLKQAAATLGSE